MGEVTHLLIATARACALLARGARVGGGGRGGGADLVEVALVGIERGTGRPAGRRPEDLPSTAGDRAPRRCLNRDGASTARARRAL